GIYQAVMDSAIGQRAAEQLVPHQLRGERPRRAAVAPDHARIRVGPALAPAILELQADVSLPSRVDAVDRAAPCRVLRILAGGDVDAALVQDRGGHDVVLDAAAAQLILGVFGIEVALPNQPAGPAVERAQPAVALSDHHLSPAADGDHERRRALLTHDV